MKRFLAALGAVLVVSAIAVCPLCAETVFTVDSAVESALVHNVSVERSKISYEALKRKSDQSWNTLIPSVKAGAGITKTNETKITAKYGLVSSSLSLSPSTFVSIREAELNYEAGKISREAALRSVELNVRKSFYSLIYERENVALLEKQLESAQREYDQTIAKQRAGLVPEVDALSAQVTLENLKPSLESARTSLSSDMATFKQLIGAAQDEPVRLDGTLDVALSLKEINLAGVSTSSDSVAALEKSLQIAKVGKSLSIANVFAPTVSLSYTYQPSQTDVTGSERTDAGCLSASVSFPIDSLLPWSSGAETARAASDTVKDVTLQLANERVSTEIEKNSLLESIGQSRSTLNARKLGVELAQRNYYLTADAYKAGTKDILALQGSSDSLQEAKVSLLKQSYTLISDVLDLENAIGVPFGTLGR
jgi:outer membrane protein TolC